MIHNDNAQHLIALAHRIIESQRDGASKAERDRVEHRLYRACMDAALTPYAGSIMQVLEDTFEHTRDYWTGQTRRTLECNAIMYAINDLRNAMDYIDERNESRARRAAYDAIMETMYTAPLTY